MGKQQSSFDALGGEDMDLLLVLLFYVQPEHCEVLFATGTVKVCSQSLEPKAVQAAVGLGADICENILFGHAVGGHDTASSPFSVGKGLPMQKVK